MTIANTTSERNCALKETLRDVPTPVSLTFPKFAGDAGRVERLRLSWYESEDCCCFEWRPVDFEDIELSAEEAVFTGRGSGDGGKGKGAASPATGKRGGFLKRTLQIIEDTATEVLENEARKATGKDKKEEDDEDEEPPA